MKKIIPFLLLLFALTSYEVNAQTCDAVTINVTVDVLDTEIDNQHAETTLTATNNVETGGEATYKAGTDVTLSPGFHAKTGSEFDGVIEDCTIAGEPFITEWDFTSGTITIPTIGPDYNYDIDWGNDGTWDVIGATGNETYTVTTNIPDTLKVAIRGDFPRMSFLVAGTQGANKLLDVIQWGTIEWDDMYLAFAGCENFNISATDAPNLSNVISMEGMFDSCSSFDSDISHWVVDNIEDMSSLFWETPFNQNISNWDVSSVKNMSRMFAHTQDFNQPLDWNNKTANVEDMSQMFQDASLFNRNINGWNVSNVTNMNSMFQFAEAFNQDLNSWDVAEVTDMSKMFALAFLFNGNISSWTPVKVTDMSEMFITALAFNQPLNWNANTLNVTNMKRMFHGAILFDQNLNAWDVGNVTDMSEMFHGATDFNGLISDWNVIKVIDMNSMFKDAESFNQPLNWGNKTASVTDMKLMFYAATSFNKDISGWDVGNVATMRLMFAGASGFNQSLGDWDIINTTDLVQMLDNTALNRGNYELTLLGWSQISGLSTFLTLGADGLEYCSTTGRDVLTGINNWFILGDTEACNRSMSSNSFGEIIAYPNPAKDRIRIGGIDTKQNNVSIQILDVSGRVVLKKQYQTEFDISSLKSGVYFIHVLGENPETLKFIKL